MRRRIRRHAADTAASALRRVDAALSVALAHSAATQHRLVGPPAPRARIVTRIVIAPIDGETVDDTMRRLLDAARRDGWGQG